MSKTNHPQKNLHQERKTYNKSEIIWENTPNDPFIKFDKWYHEAGELGTFEANAMILATASKEALPNARVVLLKEYSKEGFVFFSNYESQKGKELAQNPQVSLLFFYESMERQIRIHGIVRKISEEASDAYFYSRPIDSQFGAMASPQSKEIESQDTLEENFKSLLTSNKKPQRPSHWGGYIVQANYFEFWQGRPNRMHNRICYEFKANTWRKFLIAP
jgi:pyridoxamine 5'-phosphate oxidase